jgi:hypothetical protein
MSSFLGGTIFNIPAGIDFQMDRSVSVRVGVGDDILKLREFYGSRLFSFDVDHRSLLDEEFVLKLMGTRVRIHTGYSMLSELGEVVGGLVRMKPVCVVRPDVNLVRTLNFLTSLSIRVHIDSSASVEEQDSLAGALDFYLHNPLLTVPIQPFHSLLCTITRGHGFSLWEIESEKVGTNFYVSDQGEISLSQRWSAKGLNYGTLDDSWDRIISSGLFKRLSSFKRELFSTRSPCIYCAYLDLCAGFFRAIDDEWPCESWQDIFYILRHDFRRAKELLREIDRISDIGSVSK